MSVERGGHRIVSSKNVANSCTVQINMTGVVTYSITLPTDRSHIKTFEQITRNRAAFVLVYASLKVLTKGDRL